MPNIHEKIVIVGTGQAGVQSALSLRAEGFKGHIILVGNETAFPYQRPPLSKSFLKGTMSEASLQIVKPSMLVDRGISLRLGDEALAIDRANKTLKCRDGILQYGRMILATGARSRPLLIPGTDLDGVVMLRTVEDANAIRSQMQSVSRIAIIGGGFIGLEFAAVARELGKEVTVVESAPRLMMRVVSTAISAFFSDIHKDNGVTLLCDESVPLISGENGRAHAVALSSGQTIPADLVMVGVGALPNTALAETAGLTVRDGILVDELLRTTDPDIFAIGDCSLFPNRTDGRLLRTESIQNATDQAKHVARTIMGFPTPYCPVPWFWSDQYKYKLQIAGLPTGADTTVTRGSTEVGKFSVFSFQNGKLLSTESVNSPLDHVLTRKALGDDIPLTPELLSNKENSLKEAIDAVAKDVTGTP